MEIVFIKDLLSNKLLSVVNNEDKKLLNNLINNLNKYTTAPLSANHSQRMNLFAQNQVIYDIVLDVVNNYKIWELYSYKKDPAGLRFYDVVGYFYMISLLLCNMSYKAETLIKEIVNNIDHKYDYDLMIRILGFFKNERTITIRNLLETRLLDIKF
ncbi:hypothetical protein HW49_07340 [Porphyromonadaceae bacterium COT-184 OH4590]|nr:hypothetical protein HW49_07340 [Porphyromonadaceae bacterium COT-184 OH4590]